MQEFLENIDANLVPNYLALYPSTPYLNDFFLYLAEDM
jgi:hypothetical protein